MIQSPDPSIMIPEFFVKPWSECGIYVRGAGLIKLTGKSRKIKRGPRVYYSLYSLFSGVLKLRSYRFMLNLQGGNCVVLPGVSSFFEEAFRGEDGRFELRVVEFSLFHSPWTGDPLARLSLPIPLPILQTEAWREGHQEIEKAFLSWARIRDGLGLFQARRVLEPMLDRYFHLLFASPANFAPSGPVPDWLAAIMERMRKEWPERRSLAAWAAEAGYSPAHFHKRFSHFFGQSPRKVILETRIREAQRLLISHPEMSIADISRVCHFRSHSLFTRSFGRWAGCTPLAWRQGKKKPRR